MEKMKLLSFRSTPAIRKLFDKGLELQPGTRIELFKNAVQQAISSETEIHWKELAIAKEKSDIPNDTDSLPAENMQLKIEETSWDLLVKQIKNSYHPPLTKTTTRFVVRLTMMQYITYLKSIQPSNDVKGTTLYDSGNKEPSELEGLQMIQRLVNLLLSNQVSDKCIVNRVKDALYRTGEDNDKQ